MECEWPTWVQWFWILESSASFAAILGTIPVVLMGIILWKLDRKK